jgi:hypothetical protein
MSLKNDPASIVADPQWLPARWDRQGERLHFAWMPRSAHSEVTFLGDEYLAQLRPPSATLALFEVVAAKPPEAPPPQYIFHSAFCCSTLLARALDVPGIAMALKEPQILNDLADAARAGQLRPDLVKLVTGLLARPFGVGERVVIKPSNAANLLATGLLELDPGSNAIFLYAPLPRFLRSVADKGLWGRVWVRKLFATLRGDTGLDFGYSTEELLQLTDLQLAALAWLTHHAQAAALIVRLPGRVRTLDCETFLARRGETLFAAADHFGFGLTKAQSEEIAGGPAFATHSKEIGRSFDPEQTRQPQSRAPIIDEEIEMVGGWTEALAAHAGLMMELPPEARLLPLRCSG